MKKILLAVLLGGLLQTSAFAAKQKIHTDTAPKPIGTYSQAIKSGSIVYVSGQIAIDPKTDELVSDKFTKQVQQTLVNLEQVAIAAGGTLNDIVKLTVYLTDLNDFSAVNQAMMPLFTAPYPARAAIEIKALPKGAKEEIEAVMDLK